MIFVPKEQPPQGIDVFTKKNRRIATERPLTLAFNADEVYRFFRQKYGTGWKNRRSPNGEYNCLGHIFATRRANIYAQASEWEKIRKDDEYRELRNNEIPLPDDIATYVLGKDEILHFGRIVTVSVALSPHPPILLLVNPYNHYKIEVVSKWKDAFGEDIHSIEDVPFPAQQGGEINLKIWTERP